MDGLKMKYFVLKPEGDSGYAWASREAMVAYAKRIKRINPHLAKELMNWVKKEENKFKVPKHSDDYSRG